MTPTFPWVIYKVKRLLLLENAANFLEMHIIFVFQLFFASTYSFLTQIYSLLTRLCLFIQNSQHHIQTPNSFGLLGLLWMIFLSNIPKSSDGLKNPGWNKNEWWKPIKNGLKNVYLGKVTHYRISDQAKDDFLRKQQHSRTCKASAISKSCMWAKIK